MAKAKEALRIDGTEGDPIKIKAKEFGFVGMFHTPDDPQKWFEHMMEGVEPAMKMHVVTLIQGIVNTMALDLAKAHIALEANGIKLIDE